MATGAAARASSARPADSGRRRRVFHSPGIRGRGEPFRSRRTCAGDSRREKRHRDRWRRRQEAARDDVVSQRRSPSLTAVAGPACWRHCVEASRFPTTSSRLGRRQARLSDLDSARLREASISPSVPEAIRADVQLLLTVAQVWGEDALRQCHFRGLAEQPAASGLAGFLQSFRPKISRRS